MIGHDIRHHKVIVYQIGLQTKCSEESAEAIEPFWSATEHAIQHQDERHRKRDINHPLNKQRESSVSHLLKIDTRTESGQKKHEDEPDARPV